ncbi:MAG: hypothetical protein ACLR8Y_15810 [Alistipes indistinctus]
MLDAIRDKFIPLLRLKNIGEKALDEDKMAVVNKLTAKQKILVKRVFLMSALSVAAPDSPRYGLLEEFARTFYPDQFAEIRKKHMDVYEKRHNVIEAKLAEVGSVESAESVPNAQKECRNKRVPLKKRNCPGRFRIPPGSLIGNGPKSLPPAVPKPNWKIGRKS